MYTPCMRVSTSMRGWPHRRTDRRCGPAAHAPTCFVRVRSRVRVRLGAHASAPNRASAFRRAGPRAARLAGVQHGVCVQRRHRLVECTTCDRLLFCVRKLRPGGLHQARRVRQLGVDAANGVPDLELSLAVHSCADTEPDALADRHADSGANVDVRTCLHAPYHARCGLTGTHA
jgi:hypothetical protein